MNLNEIYHKYRKRTIKARRVPVGKRRFFRLINTLVDLDILDIYLDEKESPVEKTLKLKSISYMGDMPRKFTLYDGKEVELKKGDTLDFETGKINETPFSVKT